MKTLSFQTLLVRSLLALLVLSVGVGCSSKTSAPAADDSSNVHQPTDPTDDGSDPDDDDDTTDPVDVSQFTGIWGKYDCTYSSNLGADATSYINIGQKYITQTIRTYYTKNQIYRCSKPAVRMRYVYRYHASASSLDKNVFNVNTNLTKVEMTPATAAIAIQLNKIGYFGRKDWKVNVTQTFLPPFNAQRFPQVRYDILGVDSGYIYWGDTTSDAAHNGTTAAKRPIYIDYTTGMYRLYNTYY